MRSSRWMPVVAALGAAGLLAGCSLSPGVGGSTAAPPVRICGQTLSSTPAGLIVLSYTHPGTFHVPKGLDGKGQKLVLRLASGCTDGVKVLSSAGFRFEGGAFSSRTLPEAYTTIAAIVTRTGTGNPTLTVMRRSGSTTRIVY